MPDRPAAARLQEAAFALFDEQGFDATTVDQIAERAGVGRSTFFRIFPSKEAVIFPDHDDLLGRIGARLAAARRPALPRRAPRPPGSCSATTSTRATWPAPVPADPHRPRPARARGRRHAALPAAVPQFVRAWIRRRARRAELRAELVAGAVVTAHNLVLRRWLRGLTDAPEAEFETAMAEVERLFAGREPVGGGSVVVLGPGADLDEALAAVRRALS